MTLQPGVTCEETLITRDRAALSYPCGRKAYALGDGWNKKPIPLCHIHHPDDIKRRREARGPSQLEREIDARVDYMRKARAFDGLGETLESLLGNSDAAGCGDDVTGPAWCCHWCGQDFEPDQTLCTKDTCRGYIARAVLELAKVKP